MARRRFRRLLKVNDGGVHNNLGTGWFEELENQDSSELWSFGNLAMPRTMHNPSQRIFVNSGAASRGLRRVPPFFSIMRTMNVLYDNTVKPRLDRYKSDAE